MHVNSGNQKTPRLKEETTVSATGLFGADSEVYQPEIATLKDDGDINLDDALDDDNENPVSHTLVDAAENSGPLEIRDTQELEGEEQESKDRVGSLSPLYKES